MHQVDEGLLGDIAALVVVSDQLPDGGVGSGGVSHHFLDRSGCALPLATCAG